MARISKPGLDYFPLDVNFFQDRKVRRISNRHHSAGIAALTSLLCLIYKEKGYYVLWNQDTLFDIAQEVCCEETEMQAIIDDCLSVGLFDSYIYKEYSILTSQAIQEQYHKIITDSRRKYKLPLERFWLIKEEENEPGNPAEETTTHMTGTSSRAAGAEINKASAEVGETRAAAHTASAELGAARAATGESAMRIHAAERREIAATIPQTKQETQTDTQRKPESDMENDIKSERKKDKETERQIKSGKENGKENESENESESEKEQPPVPSNGVFQASPVAVKSLSLDISHEKREEGNASAGGISESLLQLNMDAIGIRNEQTVKAILALARRSKLGGPSGTLWKVLSSEYRTTLLKKNDPGDYILWALNHSAEFESTYNGVLKKRIRGR